MKATILKYAGRIASVEVLQQLRWELTLRAKAAKAALRPRQRRLIARLQRERPDDLKVNLGCGPLPTPGWLNVDGSFPGADLVQVFGQPLDLPGSCAAVVFCEHVLEHLDYPDAARLFLGEVWRILRPGGVFRVIVPDAAAAIRAYAQGDLELLRDLAPSEATPIEVVNKIFRENGAHRFAWDYPLLAAELERAGFATVRRAAFRDSAIAELNVDLSEEGRIAQSLYAEATKTMV